MPTHNEEDNKTQNLERVMSSNEILQYCMKSIGRIEGDTLTATLRADREKAADSLIGAPLGNEIEGRSKIVTSDLRDALEWLMPQLMAIVSDAESIVEIKPRGEEDIESAELIHAKATYDLTVKNNWFLLNYDWFQDTLLMKNGFVKAYWHKKTEKKRESYAGLSEFEYQKMLTDKDIEIIGTNRIPADAFSAVRYDIEIIRTQVIESYAKVENVHPEEIGISVGCKSIEDAEFVYHRVKRKKYEIAERYGTEMAEEVARHRDNYYGGVAQASLDYQLFNELGGVNFMYRQEEDVYILYECYFKDIHNGTPYKIVLCGNKLLEMEKNEYERPPFFTHTAFRRAHRIYGYSLYDLLKDIQRLRTALIRGILDNIAFTNNGRFIIDDVRVSVDDFINNNRPGGLIRGQADGVKVLDVPILNPWIMSVLEYIETMKESRTGIARFNQGVTQRSLHRTFRGIQAILGAFNERIGLIAKLLMEGIAGLVKFVVDINIKFMDKKEVIRIFNKWVEINPDNFRGQYDVIINVGIGTGSKEVIVSQMQQLLALQMQAMNAGLPVVTAKNYYNTMKTLLEAMGRKHVGAYITDPDTIEARDAGRGILNDMRNDNFTQQARQPAQPMQPFNPDMMSDLGFETAEEMKDVAGL